MMAQTPRLVPVPLRLLSLVALIAVACDPTDTPVPAADPPAPEGDAPSLDLLDAPWTSEALRHVVELQVAREGAELEARLDDDDPAIRTRAAFALASVRDDADRGGLLAELLEDDNVEVRRAAAFALRSAPPANSQETLLERLEEAEDPEVRAHLLAALGRHGGDEAAEALLDFELADDTEERHRTAAMARLATAHPPSEPVLDALLERLEHPDADVRKSASRFVQTPDADEAWGHRADDLRAVLDGYDASEPAAMTLVLALGALRDTEDTDRLIQWMETGEDWRIRVNAARALGTAPLLGAEGVRDALWRQVEEGPLHVAQAAAEGYARGFRFPQESRIRMAQWVDEGPPERWRTQVPLLEDRLIQDSGELLGWLDRVGDQHPETHRVALNWVGVVPPAQAEQVLERAANHDRPWIRGPAFEAEVMMRMDDGPREEMFQRVEEMLREGTPQEVTHAAEMAEFPIFAEVDSPARVLEAAEARVEEDPSPAILVPLLHAVGVVSPAEEGTAFAQRFLDHDDARVRAAASWAADFTQDEAGDVADAPPPVEMELDWELLEELGPEPRLHLETDRGKLILRLAPQEAPLTVQMVARLAREGSYDGVPVHRVVTNGLVQTGDYAKADGSGQPGFTLKTELTRIPFERGTVGMASQGPDTETSQFFITQGRREGYSDNYTAFGWLESGWEVLDELLPGDVVLEARVESADSEG